MFVFVSSGEVSERLKVSITTSSRWLLISSPLTPDGLKMASWLGGEARRVVVFPAEDLWNVPVWRTETPEEFSWWFGDDGITSEWIVPFAELQAHYGAGLHTVGPLTRSAARYAHCAFISDSAAVNGPPSLLTLGGDSRHTENYKYGRHGTEALGKRFQPFHHLLPVPRLPDQTDHSHWVPAHLWVNVNFLFPQLQLPVPSGHMFMVHKVRTHLAAEVGRRIVP